VRALVAPREQVAAIEPVAPRAWMLCVRNGSFVKRHRVAQVHLSQPLEGRVRLRASACSLQWRLLALQQFELARLPFQEHLWSPEQ
jgi:hypothetical protein